MIFLRNWYPYENGMIQEYVPPTSGVYMLFSHQDCVYVGSSRNMQEDLTNCVNGGSSVRFAEHPPDEFRFEVALGEDRDVRRAELIAELNPLCTD